LKKSADNEDESHDAGVGTAAESVIADEAFKLLQLVLRRAEATFSQIRRQSLWGSTGDAVIGRVRDSLTRVLLFFVLVSVLALHFVDEFLNFSIIFLIKCVSLPIVSCLFSYLQYVSPISVYTVSRKKSTEFLVHNFNRFTYIFIIFGTSHYTETQLLKELLNRIWRICNKSLSGKN